MMKIIAILMIVKAKGLLKTKHPPPQVFMFSTLIIGDNLLFLIVAHCVRDESCREKNSANFSKRTGVCGANRFLCT